MKGKELFKNAISGFGGQLIIVVLGIIVPRIMITNYGSDTNGLVATIAQIYTYLALLEAGIGQSARVALYKPISTDNKSEISRIFSSAEAFFRRITLFYFLGVVAISLILPFVVKSDLSYITVFLVSMLEGLAGVLSFYFIQTPSVLLNSDGKAYVNNAVNVTDKIASYLVKIILALVGLNIVVVELSFFIISIIKVIFYKIYINKKYPWLSSKGKPDFSILKDKNSYLLTEIAWTIFASTDIIVISIFVNTKESSVYSIYNMVFNNLNLLLKSIGASVIYVLGQKFNKDKDEYKIYHHAFDSFFTTMITVLMSTSYLLIIPFIRLYTRNVTDVNYVNAQLPLLFALIQMMSWNRYISGNLTGLAGYAKKTSYVSIIEAITNVVLSVILVNIWGIVGVLIATVVSLPIKVVWCIYVTDVKVFNRSVWKSVLIYGVNYGLFGAFVFLYHFLSLDSVTVDTYGEFAILGAIVMLIVSVIVFGINILINPKTWRIVWGYFKKSVAS